MFNKRLGSLFLGSTIAIGLCSSYAANAMENETALMCSEDEIDISDLQNATESAEGLNLKLSETISALIKNFEGLNKKITELEKKDVQNNFLLNAFASLLSSLFWILCLYIIIAYPVEWYDLVEKNGNAKFEEIFNTIFTSNFLKKFPNKVTKIFSAISKVQSMSEVLPEYAKNLTDTTGKVTAMYNNITEEMKKCSDALVSTSKRIEQLSDQNATLNKNFLKISEQVNNQ